MTHKGKHIAVIGDPGTGARSMLLMYTVMAAFHEGFGVKIISPPDTVPYNPKRSMSRKKEFITCFGNGKRPFVFETDCGQITIWADYDKSVQKKLKTVNGMNLEISKSR